MRVQMILKNCRAAVVHGGRVLLIEAVIQRGTANAFTNFTDLAMLVMTGGREPTEAEYCTLLDRAGFRLKKITLTNTEMSLIEARPV